MNRNNSHNEFVGNFDSFFDNESSLTGLLDLGGGEIGSVSPPRNPRNLTVSSAGPKILSPAIDFVSDNTPKYRCKVTPPFYIRDDINGTILDYTKCPKKGVSVGVSAPQTPPSSGSGSGSDSGSGSGSGSTTGGDGTISDTVSTGSNQSETTTEQKPSVEVKKTESDCKVDYIKISVFVIIGVVLGYFIAKKLKKDPFVFCIIGGIINAIIGYLYYKNKCK